MKVFNEITSMYAAYRAGGYPPFVYKGKKTSRYLPIFFYHDIEGRELEQHLRFLTDNSYSSVGCDEAVTALQDGREVDGKVMLTFDDGLASLYRTVFPVIRAFRTRVVAFLVSEWIGQPGFVTWDQCREMHASGLVDFQSHSHSHRKRVSEISLRGVWNRFSSGMPWDVPELRPSYLQSGMRFFPIFPGRSIFDSTTVYELPESFWNICMNIHSSSTPVRGDGVIGAFRTLLEQYGPQAVRKEGANIVAEMVSDLITSKKTIETELKGHHVEHFAFPWHLNNTAAWTALEQAGFRSGATGLKQPGAEHFSHNVRKLFRVNGDFVFCLPGKERMTFAAVLRKKIIRRLRKFNY